MMISFAGRFALVAAASGFLMTSCAVDTEFGVGTTVESATVTTAGSGAAATIRIDVTVQVREGAHATGERMFIVPAADVFAGEHVIATINLDRPAGFDGTLSPGETQHLTLHGTTLPGGFSPDALCMPPMTRTRVLVHWQDRTNNELGTAEMPSATVTCGS